MVGRFVVELDDLPDRIVQPIQGILWSAGFIRRARILHRGSWIAPGLLGL